MQQQWQRRYVCYNLDDPAFCLGCPTNKSGVHRPRRTEVSWYMPRPVVDKRCRSLMFRGPAWRAWRWEHSCVSASSETTPRHPPRPRNMRHRFSGCTGTSGTSWLNIELRAHVLAFSLNLVSMISWTRLFLLATSSTRAEERSIARHQKQPALVVNHKSLS